VGDDPSRRFTGLFVPVLTWFTPISDVTLTQALSKVLDLLMKITMPFVFCIVLWVYSITRADEYWQIRYRVISWGVVSTVFIFLLNALNHIIFVNVFKLSSLVEYSSKLRAIWKQFYFHYPSQRWLYRRSNQCFQ
jgi:hypothetical protein